jgi:hypothetical protein
MAWMLWIGISPWLPPAPNGTECRIEGKPAIVVGRVSEPFIPEIPNRVFALQNDRFIQHGWVWKKTFREYGVPVLNVCCDRDGKMFLVPPYAVWSP